VDLKIEYYSIVCFTAPWHSGIADLYFAGLRNNI